MRKAIICGALMALAITTASAQQGLFSANSVLPGCKAMFEEGRGLGRQDTGYRVGTINALVFLAPTECIEATSSRNDGRDHLGMPGRLHRNPHVSASLPRMRRASRRIRLPS